MSGLRRRLKKPAVPTIMIRTAAVAPTLCSNPPAATPSPRNSPGPTRGADARGTPVSRQPGMILWSAEIGSRMTGMTLLATRLARAAGPPPGSGGESRARLNPWRLKDADLRSYMLLGSAAHLPERHQPKSWMSPLRPLQPHRGTHLGPARILGFTPHGGTLPGCAGRLFPDPGSAGRPRGRGGIAALAARIDRQSLRVGL